MTKTTSKKRIENNMHYEIKYAWNVASEIHVSGIGYKIYIHSNRKLSRQVC